MRNDNESPPQPLPPITPHQVVMLVLSLYVVLAIVAQELVPLDAQVRLWLDRIDTGICLYFLYDFGLRLYQAPDKLAFLRWGWIDLLASMPAFHWGRLGQLVRVFRILRMLRAFRAARNFVVYLLRNRANGTLAIVFASAILLLLFGAIAILYVERGLPEANIKTPADALWWAFVTITTVGYGDRFPVTNTGRLIAAVLMIAGVGLFGTFTGYVANFFVEADQAKEDDDLQTLIQEVRQLREKIEALENRQK
ncbi:potassium channel family protein [Fibrella arboris]|uniref:potassium channel family protein n=1 Tax=Fibrella arboris TaxID=3242486 RepID=UPI00352218E6